MIRFLLAFCLLCSPLSAQIKVLPEYATGQPVIAEVTFPDAPEGSTAHLIWTIGGEAGYYPLSSTKSAIWPKYTAKTQALHLRCSGFLTTAKDGVDVYVKDSHREFEAVTKILGIDPTPEPDPDDPDPPTPTPDGEAPIPEPGFRVLMIYESSKLQDLPTYVYDQDLRDYLTTHCVRGPSNVAEWRMVDPQVVTAPDSAIWAKALGRKRDSLPWVLISDGKHGYEGPLPKDKAAMMDLLRKYGGA